MEMFRNADCDDNNVIPVPDWFHLSMCVFLGECTRSDSGLVQDFCKIMGPSYVINLNVSKSNRCACSVHCIRSLLLGFSSIF
jgi:hypothetical protein